MGATPEDIARLYQVFLGREPESAAVIEEKCKRSLIEVVEELLTSDEFRERMERSAAAAFLERIAGFQVTDRVSRDDLERLFRESQRYWETIGASDETAYWSVVTDERWAGPLDPETIRNFYWGAGANVNGFVELVTEVRPDFSLERARVLDFGCGVGRMLFHFVDKAAWCEGWDFSGSHLELLQHNLSELFGIDEGRYGVRLIDSPDIAAPDPGFDLIVSVLVLQHNPPPLMRHLVRELLRSLAPKGVALLHIPTAALEADYDFALPAYWSRPKDVMEMHALPMGAIYEVAAEEGATIRRSGYWDKCSPELLSELFVFVKEG